MPFTDMSDGPAGGAFAQGLTQDIITRLAKLRSLFVIARGSVFALAAENRQPLDAARALNVDYVVSGSIRLRGPRLIVMTELVDVRTERIVWTEVFDNRFDDTFAVLDEIGSQIVSMLASGIEMEERNRAVLKAPNSLNAWEAYHRGLWHMYRFTREENEIARDFFEMAIRLDPTFARAHAGMSFIHWQKAFQAWGDRQRESDLALEAAGKSLFADENDPAAHWAMGRSLWLRLRHDEAVAELNKAVELSPNFALGHYCLSFVHAQTGDPLSAIESADHSRALSPFDPLLFGMLGTRAIAHVRLGQFEEAAAWAIKAAARPNAHAHILSIAAHCLALTGRVEEARDLHVDDPQVATWIQHRQLPRRVSVHTRRSRALSERGKKDRVKILTPALRSPPVASSASLPPPCVWTAPAGRAPGTSSGPAGFWPAYPVWR
jgi:TolB-like protein/Tfp pilus assembly protein PilF